MKQQWNAAKQVILQLEQAGFEAVFVGGAVRDFLLARPVHDVDVATGAMPEEVKAVFTKTVDIGIEHGTVLVLDQGEPIEVTTYRTDGEYVDHRRPDGVTFVRSLQEDLQRRDFTMNAIAMDANDRIIDLYGGQQDIAQKTIRAVGNPSARFSEDALRMLRAVRFSAQLGFTIEPATLEAIQEHAQEISYVARERIAAEFEKMWVSSSVKRGIDALVATCLVDYLPGNIRESQEKWADFQATEAAVGWAYMAFLLGDWQSVVQGYRLSNKTKAFIQQVITAYDRLQEGWQPLHYFEYELSVLEAAYDFAIWQNECVPFSKDEIALSKANLPIQMKQQLDVSGHDFMKWNDGKRGPWIKVVMDQVLEAVLSGKLQNDNEHIKNWFVHHFQSKL